MVNFFVKFLSEPTVVLGLVGILTPYYGVSIKCIT